MRRHRPFAALLIVALATVTLGGRALGQQSDKQQELQQQVDETSAAEQSAREHLTQAQSGRARLDAALADVTTRVAAAGERLAAAQATVQRLGFDALVLQAKVDATQAKLAVAQDDIRRSAVLLYRGGDSSAMIGLLDGTNGSGQIVEGKHYLQRVSDKRQDDARRVTKLKNDLDSQQQDLAAQQQSANDARAAAADEKDALDALAAQQLQARDAAASAEHAESDALSVASTQHAEAEAASQAESDRVAALANSAGGGPALGDGTFIWPVSGSITSPFGPRTDPITGAGGFHAGIDIGASCSTPIKAAGAGVVLSAGATTGGYGNMTLLNHGGGLSTLYGHQSSIIVSAGQSVTQGQVIGYVGSTGKSTGCHLHFEVRVNGNPVDPTGYL